MEADNELRLKIGRNLLLFQKAEHLLKLLSYYGQYYIPFGVESKEALKKHGNRIANETLGQVANTLRDSVYQESPPGYSLAATPDSGCGISFGSAVGEPIASRHRQFLVDLVRERNEFVHRLYPKIQLAADDASNTIALELDEQHERFSPLISELEQLHRTLSEIRAEMFDFFSSQEGLDFLLAGSYQRSPVVLQLAEIVDRIADKDGWTSLSKAIRAIEATPAFIREELEKCETKSVSELLRACRLFELKPVPSDNGSTRMLFRRIRQRPKQLFPDSSNSISLSSPDLWSLLEPDDDAPPLHFHFRRGLGFCHGPSIAISGA